MLRADSTATRQGIAVGFNSDIAGYDAGAIVDGGTMTRGQEAGQSIDECLKSASSNEFLAASGDLIDTVPAGTNVMDLVMGLKNRCA